MAPVISCIETLVGQRVTVTFSIDIRDAKLAERLQVPLSPWQQYSVSVSAFLTPLQRNENGIVDDIIRALHQLSERKFNPEIVRRSPWRVQPLHRLTSTVRQVAAAVEGKPIAGFWAEAATRLLGSADAPLTLIRNFRPQGRARLGSTHPLTALTQLSSRLFAQ